ncbi:MAG: DUF1569 domain-containing protein [Planctomycetes bacterium]|nr:DUF1569 domain-containing protein [Planctomycetota bacterium]
MPQRALEFKGFPEVVAELDRLHQSGYTKLGQWDLAQICNHLGYFIQASLDGPKATVPWILKFLFGRFVLRRILKQRRMKAGAPTPQKPLPAPGGDESAAVERLKHEIERFRNHHGELHASPFFGYLTPQEWSELHLIHCAHHLGFLSPKSGS